jgi:hypothetical protein
MLPASTALEVMVLHVVLHVRSSAGYDYAMQGAG